MKKKSTDDEMRGAFDGEYSSDASGSKYPPKPPWNNALTREKNVEALNAWRQKCSDIQTDEIPF